LLPAKVGTSQLNLKMEYKHNTPQEKKIDQCNTVTFLGKYEKRRTRIISLHGGGRTLRNIVMYITTQPASTEFQLLFSCKELILQKRIFTAVAKKRSTIVNRGCFITPLFF
jgi:hypothetical protein